MSVAAQTDVKFGSGERRLAQARVLALAGLIGPALFTTLVILQGLLQPDYSHVKMPISALAAWPTGWIQNVNFYIVGGLIIAFASALQLAVRPTRRGRVGTALLALGGVGVLLAGIFPWKMVDGVPTETAPHVASAITAFVATGVGFVVVSRRMSTDPRWRDLASYTMYSGMAVLVLFVAVGFFAVDNGAPLHLWAGLLQRILCAVLFACMMVLAARVRAICRHP